jgi:lysyl-tRNA synthetase, class II
MLTEKFLSAELLDWSKTSGLYPQIESILESIEKGFYEPQKGSKMILALIEFALDKKAPNLMNFDDFKGLLDEGDYIQVNGKLDYSNTGEPSLIADNITILTKSLRPLPDTMEYDNTESRYLDRVADFKNNTNDEKSNSVRDIVRAKAKYWSIWREEMANEGFTEVECPIFESTPGGAEAKPFTTFYNELDQDMYLRISLELPLKKLIAGGFEKVYEIGRIFRNEGSSPQHLQEYTQIEWYCAYTDYVWAAKFTKRVYQRVVKELLNTEIQTDYYGNKINWGNWCTPKMAKANGWKLLDNKEGWPMIPYFEAVRYFSKGEIDTENKTAQELCELGKKFDLELTPEMGMGTLLDKLWKKARVNTRDPFFLTLPPVELEPLAKRDPTNPDLTQRWQIVAGTAELGKAFSELNDPVDQFGRFEDQQKARDAGNDEAQFMDESYVKAMEYGMPPMSGFGTSERFVSFLLGKHIRECVTFPHVRKESNTSKEVKIKQLQDQIKNLNLEISKLGGENINPKAKPEVKKPAASVNFTDLNFGSDTVLEYWKDSYLFESTAKVTDIMVDETGTWIELDKTIFYPQGGGQPSDTGKVFLNSNDFFVVTKCVKERNKVRHYGFFENESNSAIYCGSDVKLRVDKENRIQNINLHSTAHLMDYAISELKLDWKAEKGYSFPEGPYVQYSGEVEVNDKLIADIESKVNELRLKNLDFVVNYTQEGDQILRSILINGISDCSCGGTHINNTSELPQIKVRKISCKKGVIKLSYCME